MCGIVGTVERGTRIPDTDLLRAMAKRIEHRGPDGEGYFTGAGIGLGMRRLSIIDLVTGQQPMHNEDRTAWVVFNGEIYNYRELRADLEGRGHRFSTQSDTEAIVHAYEQDGDDFPHRLRGMFAIALWDARRRRLVLVRDRLGKKPLLYAALGDRLVFGSEIAALLEHPAVPRAVDPVAVGQFLTYQAVPAPRTGFAAIRKLPPGHLLVWEDGRITVQAYWRPTFLPKRSLEPAAASAEVRQRLTDAVRVRLVSDVPLGAFLSGGIDSSAVVGLMAEAVGPGVKTFSIGFEDDEYDELPYARLVARRFATDHHEFVVKPNAVEVLPTLVRHFGEPFADPSAVPTYHLARLAREHVTVALCGDGGDEVFSGYERHAKVLALERPARFLGPLIRPLMVSAGSAHGMRLRDRIRRRLADLAAPTALRYRRWLTVVDAGLAAGICEPDFLARASDASDGVLAAAAMAGPLDPVDLMCFIDMVTYLPTDLLPKVDVASMANSLEVRSPFLDHEVVELGARLPAALKRVGKDGKRVLRDAVRDLVPSEILTRPKHGFSVPVGRWLRGELSEMAADLLLSPTARTSAYFRRGAVAGLFEAHRTGHGNYGGVLWALLTLELWHRLVVDAGARA